MKPEIVKAKFEAVMNKLKVEVDYYKCIKTFDNETGDIIKTFNAPVKIFAIFNAPTDTYLQKVQGLTENSALRLYVLPENDLQRDDEIVFDGSKYRVDNPTTHQWAGVNIYTHVDLYLIERL